MGKLKGIIYNIFICLIGMCSILPKTLNHISSNLQATPKIVQYLSEGFLTGGLGRKRPHKLWGDDGAGKVLEEDNTESVGT